jgi:hypothetical protein
MSSHNRPSCQGGELKKEPPKGTAYSVAIPGTEQPGRSRVYRAWNAQKELLKTLDPQARPSRQI